MANPSQIFQSGTAGDNRLFYQNPQGQYTQIASPTELQSLASQGLVQVGGQRGVLPSGANVGINQSSPPPAPTVATDINANSGTPSASGSGGAPTADSVGKLETKPGVYSSSSLVDYYQNEIERNRPVFQQAQSNLGDINKQITDLYNAPSFQQRYMEDLNRAVTPIDTQIAQQSNELNQINGALSSIEQDVRSRVGGQAPESYIQALVAKEGQPLLNRKQVLQEGIGMLQNQRSQAVAGVDRGITLAQSDAERRLNILDTQRTLAKDTVDSFNSLIEKGATATDKERDDARTLFTSFLQQSPDFLRSLSEDEVAQMERGVIPYSALQKLGDTIQEQKIAETAANKRQNLPASVAEYEYAKSQGYKGSFTDYQNEDANRKARITNPSGLDTATASRVDRLVGQFDGEPIVKNFNVLQEAKESVKSFVADPSSTNDQALIYAFAKAMDPNSVVREGEYATVQKYAQSWATKLGFDANRLFSEDPQFLSDQARKSIINTINQKFDVVDKQYSNLTNEYGRRVDQITGSKNGKTYLTNYSGAFSDSGGQSGGLSASDLADLRMMFPDYSDEEIISAYGGGGGFKNDPSMSLNGSLGSLSARYESGGDPAAIGYDNTGGWSYGAYQLAHNNAKAFVDQSPYASQFKGITFNSEAWRNKWKQIAQSDPQGFLEEQHDYIKRTHYDPQVKKLESVGFDVESAPRAVQDVIWSTAVQHGPNNDIIKQAIAKTKSNDPEELIRNIYELRWAGGRNFGRSTDNVKKSVFNRFFGPNGEMQLALMGLRNSAQYG